MKSIPRILIVDDDRNFLRVLEYQIRQLGLEVDVAERGADALAQLSQKKFDLLVTDLKMPGMQGRELIREARRIYPAIPVVVLTAHSFAEQEDPELRSSFFCLSKPFEVEMLYQIILGALKC